ncbi:hypothetical protein EJ05DRAFT_97699 [Pseudovirgaria hyperparasitica]|uniref:Uncharacterized protein n=1 Tax=Pseudovirgaria hyperparasitica TaxID=470096 RepID=A0A6A6VZM5_9PEZI|nr:uncharacterized protein EJ05DRAFT_97699 [Pseudovirgaria hyperparasitica]KAF2755306.1 hypothetical protein EJ05DRAFT_97699 [Pseudovirgaria hyperparasitica]
MRCVQCSRPWPRSLLHTTFNPANPWSTLHDALVIPHSQPVCADMDKCRRGQSGTRSGCRIVEPVEDFLGMPSHSTGLDQSLDTSTVDHTRGVEIVCSWFPRAELRGRSRLKATARHVGRATGVWRSSVEPERTWEVIEGKKKGRVRKYGQLFHMLSSDLTI